MSTTYTEFFGPYHQFSSRISHLSALLSMMKSDSSSLNDPFSIMNINIARMHIAMIELQSSGLIFSCLVIRKWLLVLVFILFIFIALDRSKSYNAAPHSRIDIYPQVTIYYIHNHKLFKWHLRYKQWSLILKCIFNILWTNESYTRNQVTSSYLYSTQQSGIYFG